MTKKQFEAIAKAIKEATVDNKNYIRYDQLLTSLADYFETENPSFSRYRFFKACGEYLK